MNEKKIIIDGQGWSYFLENRPGHSLRLGIKEGRIYLFKPRWVTTESAQEFLLSRRAWLERTLKKEREQISLLPLSPQECLIFKEKLQARLEYFNRFYNFNWRQVSVRHQTTRWGSCSAGGTLSFNSRIQRLPENLQDYIIVHELCHLGEANHSNSFWALVARVIPDYQKCRQQLRQYRLANFIDNNNIL